MAPSAFTVGTVAKCGERTAADMLATLGVTQEQFGRHQEQLRRSLLSPQGASHGYQNKSLPFPLNLPPSYPTYPSTSATTAPSRHARPFHFRHGASVMLNQVLHAPATVREEYTCANDISNASWIKGKGKRSLDAFMHSRQGTWIKDSDPFSSDSDTSSGKMLTLPEDSQNSDSSALPSSSPPPSSPVCTPGDRSPRHSMYMSPSSPTPRPKRRLSTRDTSDLPYTLPPGPYSREKPSWSLAALIGQAINASYSGALPLNDIYSYISTVYPHYNRRDQPWMSSVRHSLSVNEAFERVPDQEGSSGRRGRGKGMTRLKGGLWRIKPGHQACFEGGNFVRKGAKGPGPGKNLGGRKRARDDAEERSEKKSKGEGPSATLTDSISRPNSRLMSTSSQPLSEMASGSSSCMSSSIVTDPSYLAASTLRGTSPSPSTASPSTAPSQSLLRGYSDLQPSSGAMVDSSPGSPELPLALLAARRDSSSKPDTTNPVTSLEPGLELDMSRSFQTSPKQSGSATRVTEADRELFTRVLASTSSVYAQRIASEPSKAARLTFPPPFASSPGSGGSSSPVRPTTPPPRQTDSGVAISPVRTPISHRGLHMSPSRSLAHYKSSLEPEWKFVHRPMTPPPRDRSDGYDRLPSMPNRLTFPSGSLPASQLQTPERPLRTRHGHGYDPYDPNTLLADELAGIRNANESQESPGGFFGKEGKKLLYESPSVPGRSDWRFRDEV